MTSPRASYFRPQRAFEAELEVRRSRFVSHLFPISSREQALQTLMRLRGEHLEANHICWGYLVGHPDHPVARAFGDDGEPAGTAGLPIINALQRRALGDTMAAVVRYFGGVKLGAGGLIRAYGGATRLVIEQSQLIPVVPSTVVTIRFGYGFENPIRHLLTELRADLLDVDHGAEVTARARVPDAAIAPMSDSLNQITSGCVSIDQQDPRLADQKIST